MQEADLRIIERVNVVLGVGATAVAGLVWGGAGMLAAGAGAALANLNFWALRRLGARAVDRVARGASPREALLLVAGLVTKMVALFGLIWLAVRGLGLAIIPFTVGFSVLVVSVLVTGLFLGLSDSKAEA